MAKKNLLNVQKKVGVTYEYFTKSLRILGSVVQNDFYKNDNTYMIKVYCYVKWSDSAKKMIEAWDYTTFNEAEDTLIDFIEDNFSLENLDKNE